MSHKVLVVGTGTIGEPLIGLLAEHQKQLGLDDVLFFKRTPLSEEQGKVEALLRKGAKIVSTSDALNEFHSLGFTETSDVEQAYEDADVIIDCTPSGNENWDKIYTSLNQDKRFMAQGSEHGFGPFFAWGINNEVLEEESKQLIEEARARERVRVRAQHNNMRNKGPPILDPIMGNVAKVGHSGGSRLKRKSVDLERAIQKKYDPRKGGYRKIKIKSKKRSNKKQRKSRTKLGKRKSNKKRKSKCRA